MLKVLECKRDESMKPFDAETAQQLATELYNAGGGKTIGVYVHAMRVHVYVLLSSSSYYYLVVP